MSLFSLGKIVMTPGAIQVFEEAQDSPFRYIARHSSADWGEVEKEDWKANDDALLEGLRILSVYIIKSGERVWIITESDRTSTTILLPEEY
jgi:hypothetical protein